MSDPHGHTPDPAALDELLRAFGESPSRIGDGTDTASSAMTDQSPPDEQATAAADRTGDAGLIDATPTDREPRDDLDADPSAGPAGEPDEVFIVEQAPLTDPTPEPATPPTIVRIDDYSGSVVVAVTSIDTPSAPTSEPATTDAPVVSDEPPTVISIDDGGLPDPVYIKGNLEKSGTRSIVFIEDDDTGDTLAPDAERDIRRGIEPRMRERRAAVKRALGRKRLRWVLLASVVVLVGVGVLALLGSGLFAIEEDQVTVTGQSYADPAILQAVVDDLVGTPALLVDTQQAERRLEAIPWVEEARVRVQFPHTAVIELRERRAMTTYQGPDQRYRVLDREGRVLAVRDGYPIAYLLIVGPDAVDLDPAEFAPQGYVAASELAKNLPGAVRGRVVSIEVTADGSDLSLLLDDGTQVRFGAALDLLDKLTRLTMVLTTNPDREPGPIDVSTSEVTL